MHEIEHDLLGRERPDAPLLFDRREFLKLMGGGILVCFVVGDWATPAGAQRREYPTDFNAYLLVGADGRVTVFSGKIEMGQGVVTSLAMMAAEELRVPLASVDMVMGDTDRCPWDMGTFGSLSTRFFGPPLRAAAAEARAVLLELAAERLRAPVASLSAEDGAVFVTAAPARRATYGELAKGRRIERHLSGKPTLRAPASFTLSGKATRRTDAREKATGRAKYAGDERLPGMLYARVLRPPAHGATLKRLDTSAAERMNGITVVRRDDLVAVLHADPEAAAAALAAIVAEYDVPPATVDTESVFDRLIEKAPAPEDRESKGDLEAGRKLATTRFQHRWENGYGAHAAIETHTALASFDGDQVTIRSATQTPYPDQQEIAEALELPAAKVRLVPPYVGGGFGGKAGTPRAAIEAARLARITGKPVQVAFTRAEEFFWDTFRAAGVVLIESGLDAAGKVVLWDYDVHGAGSRGAEQFYDVPNHRLRVRGRWGQNPGGVHPFAVGPWRAPGANLNVFARESQLDVMAAKAGVDPLEFRLDNTSDARMRGVLEAAAGRFGWTPAAGPSGRGAGLACGIDAGTYAAVFAEVAVDRASGRVSVKRMVCAQDMGQVVNPDGARMQMEGCLVMGLGYALTETLRFKGGDVLDRSFATYEVPRLSMLPEIETVLVPNDALSPQGGGEPAIVPVGGAIANAIFDATGARLFRMPFTPESVKAAITKS